MLTSYADINPESGSFNGMQVSLGALGDSFYEYLVKLWVLTGKRLKDMKHLYEEQANLIVKTMIMHNNHWTCAELLCLFPSLSLLHLTISQTLPRSTATEASIQRWIILPALLAACLVWAPLEARSTLPLIGRSTWRSPRASVRSAIACTPTFRLGFVSFFFFFFKLSLLLLF